MSWNDIKDIEQPKKADSKAQKQQLKDSIKGEKKTYQIADSVNDDVLFDTEEYALGDFDGLKETFSEGFKERMRKENKRTATVLDAGYYFVVCFNNREQLNEACEALDFDKTSLYFDGKDFMRAIKRCQRKPDLEFPNTRKIDKDFEGMVMSEQEISDAIARIEALDDEEE